MEEYRKKVEEYEQRLQQNKKQLQVLTEEMVHLERELAVLKQGAGLTAEKQLLPGPVMQSTQSAGNFSQRAKRFRRQDLEKTVGKSLMGVFASVLIFISLILFATLLLPYFNNTAKMITTYLVSVAFTGFGLWKLQKDRENKFYIAVTGCGIGAVYISLLLSNFYFKMMGDIALYVWITLWAASVCVLAKLKNSLFQVIGQLGITIAMIFGTVICMAADDSGRFFALIVFYLVSSSVFYIVHREEEFSKNRVHYIFNAVNCIALYAGCDAIPGDSVPVVNLVIMLIPAAYLVLMLFQRAGKRGVDFGVIFSAYGIVSICFLLLLFDGKELAAALGSYVFCLVFVTALEFRKKETDFGRQIPQAVFLWLAVYGLGMHEELYTYGLAVLVILPLLFAGFLRKNKVFCYGSILAAAWMYVCTEDGSAAERLFLGGLVLAAAFFLLYRCKEQYDRKWKLLVHGVTVLFLWRNVPEVIRLLTKDSDIRTAVTYGICTLFNIVMVKSCFGKNLQSGEKEKTTLYNIINLFAMLAGMLLIAVRMDEVPHLIVILTTLAAFLTNAKNLLDKREHLVAGIYVGVKFTLLMITILGSFNTVNYVVSIACFLLAIIGIVIGFKAEYRSLRLFGLALSLISTFKLIMVDISYENTLGNALSFFTSGLLCFAISRIYNLIAKKHEEKE
ncbi:MAG: DUF2339 domain-containing protein [Lachnospiraceae bacterium]|nr:DUF2339 domain-containing protein [Lachnospiraceae bacterium]